MTIIKANIVRVEVAGEIPEELAAETMRILEIHRLNGDLGWVKDMIHDLEAQQKDTPKLGEAARQEEFATMRHA